MLAYWLVEEGENQCNERRLKGQAGFWLCSAEIVTETIPTDKDLLLCNPQSRGFLAQAPDAAHQLTLPAEAQGTSHLRRLISQA